MQQDSMCSWMQVHFIVHFLGCIVFRVEALPKAVSPFSPSLSTDFSMGWVPVFFFLGKQFPSGS